MKSIIVILGLITAVFTLKVNAQHEHHNTDHATTQKENKIQSHEVSEAFRQQLSNVIQNNQKLNEAFVSGKEETVKKAAENVESALSSVDMKLLPGEAHIDWMNHLKTLKDQVSTIKSAGTIEEQRKTFVSYNEALYSCIKAFGIGDQTVFYQHCPMANGGKGANWLSLEKEIKNPYYGQMMLTCGSTTETIQGL